MIFSEWTPFARIHRSKSVSCSFKCADTKKIANSAASCVPPSHLAYTISSAQPFVNLLPLLFSLGLPILSLLSKCLSRPVNSPMWSLLTFENKVLLLTIFSVFRKCGFTGKKHQGHYSWFTECKEYCLASDEKKQRYLWLPDLHKNHWGQQIKLKRCLTSP